MFRLRATVSRVLSGVLVRRGLARKLSSALGNLEGAAEEGVNVRERLRRNILRAGLRALKGDARELIKNVQERGSTVDVQKLVPTKFIHVFIMHVV